ncbi:MAG: tetratricopeptide repeat protein [Pirellulaceae bacterium]
MTRSSKLTVTGLAWWLALVCGSYCDCDSHTMADEVAAAEPQVLYLHTEYIPYQKYVDQGIPYRLGREIVRQAVLLTARDELGLATCDETLQETIPKHAQVIHLMPMERADLNGKWNLKLIPYDMEGPTWEKTYDYVPDGTLMYADMIPKLEADSRGVFPDALRAAGFQGAKPPLQAPVPPGDEIEELLGKVDFVAQFGAVRAAHQAIALHGETPEWLGVLVRGYANLTLLTEHHWNSTTEVFTARSWLYAQRMITVCQESDVALWHRAYAWTLGGALQHALADLVVLEQRHQSEAGSTEEISPSLSAPAAWMKLIKPYCMCDRALLKQVGEENPAVKPWASLLRFEIASSYRQQRWMFEEAQEIKEIAPTAYRVYANLVAYGAYLALSRSGAAWGSEMFARSVPQSLTTLPGVPPSIPQLIASNKPRRGLLGALFGAGNSPELFSALPMSLATKLREEAEQSVPADLSWSALAYLLEEEQFIQIVRFFHDATDATERSLVDEVDAALPLIKTHRYAAFIDKYRYDRRQDEAKIHDLLGTIRIQDPRMHLYSMIYAMLYLPSGDGRKHAETAWAHVHRNFTKQGMLEYLNAFAAAEYPFAEASVKMFVTEVRVIIPHSDCATFLEIKWTKDPTPEQLKQWESQLKEDPRAFSALAARYRKVGDLESAIRCCEKSLASSPTVDAATLLAELHLQRNDSGKWEQTLLDYLETEDLGVEHGSVQAMLALGYADRGQWRKAKPFAEAYGQTWSASGLMLSSKICEGLAEWEKSEHWMHGMSESYPSGGAYLWYFWCRRTGRGDVEAARELATSYFAAANRQTREAAILEGVFHLLNDDMRKGLEAYRGALAFKPTFTCTFMVGQLARELGDEKMRGNVLNTMQKACIESADDDPENQKVNAAGLAIIQLMKSGDASKERLSRLDELLVAVDETTRSAFAYFLGKELHVLGKSSEADLYWRRALVLPNHDVACATLAGFELAKRHGTSRPEDDVLEEEDLWPLPAVKTLE